MNSVERFYGRVILKCINLGLRLVIITGVNLYFMKEFLHLIKLHIVMTWGNTGIAPCILNLCNRLK
jgi:hypothetical protein